MGMVTLTEVWFHDAADLTDNIDLGANAFTELPTAKAPVRRFANGTTRLIIVPGVPKSYAVTFPWPARTDADWLRDHTGELLQFRDTFGRKMFGRFEVLEVNEVPDPDETVVESISLTFDEVTHTEEV
jgi:hypothetical protein